jgi:hypothetical protein
MEARASDAEKKVQELNAKLERVSAKPWLSSLSIHNFYSLCGYQLLEMFHLLSTLKYIVSLSCCVVIEILLFFMLVSTYCVVSTILTSWIYLHD